MHRFYRLIVCVCVVGCGAGAPAVDLDAERSALLRADSLYAAAASAKDVDRITQLYTTDAILYPPGVPVVNGIDAVRQFATDFASAPGLAMTIHPPTVELSQAGDIGYTITTVEISVTGADGNAVHDRIRDVHIWKKQSDGSWKVAVDIWNSDAAPSPAAPSR